MCGECIAYENWPKMPSNPICCRRCQHTKRNYVHSSMHGIQMIARAMCTSNQADSHYTGMHMLARLHQFLASFLIATSASIRRNPVAQSTDGSRGKIGFNQGRHAWEVMWEGPLGTVAVVGISTRDAALQCSGYVALLGADEHSWGWNLVDNHLLHKGDAIGSYPLLNNAPKYQVGERIRVILDCDDNTLSFEKNYEFLGVAFRGTSFHFEISQKLNFLK